ncbi:MAG: PEP-CTERM sorting domain-containing protein [Myxococcota bacterium]
MQTSNRFFLTQSSGARRVRRLGVILGSLLLAAAASATPVTFSGAGGFGTSEAEALAAQSAGIQLVDLDQLFTFRDETDPNPQLTTTRFLDDTTLVLPPDPSTSAEITSNWTATSGAALIGDTYLAFVRPLPNTLTATGQSFDYCGPNDCSNVGIELTNDPNDSFADWVILRVPSVVGDPLSDPVYYPAIELGRLPDGFPTGSSAAFQIQYLIENRVVVIDPSVIELGVPQWQLNLGFVVPEPSTALLLGLGLGVLAAGRRRSA